MGRSMLRPYEESEEHRQKCLYHKEKRRGTQD